MKKKVDEELFGMLTELMELVNDMPFAKKPRNKRIIDSMMKTFADVMVNNTAFIKLMADPTTDLSKFEPIIKTMMKKTPKKSKKKKK